MNNFHWKSCIGVMLLWICCYIGLSAQEELFRPTPIQEYEHNFPGGSPQSPGDTLLLYTVKWFWNDTIQQWIPNLKDTFSYDDQFNRIIEQFYEYENGTWNNRAYFTFDYDSLNRNTHYIFQTWNNGWENSKQYFFNYIDSIHQRVDITQNWSNGDWKNGLKTERMYDSLDHQSSITTFGWSGTTWTRVSRILFFYENGHEISHINQSWKTTDWINSTLDTYNYNQEGQLIEYTRQKWVNTDWSNLQRQLYTYNALGDRSIQVYQYVDSLGSWFTSGRSLFEYDDDHNRILSTGQDSLSGSWFDINHESWSYIPGHRKLSNSYEFKDINWINQDSTHYYYSATTSVHELPNVKLLTLYPNPSTQTIEFNLEDELRPGYRFEIFTSDAKRIHSGCISTFPVASINIGDLTPGLYYIRVQTDKTMFIGRIMKQ